jgi:hypothetical protein
MIDGIVVGNVDGSSDLCGYSWPEVNMSSS